MRTYIYLAFLIPFFSLLVAAAPTPEPYSAGIDGVISDTAAIPSTFFASSAEDEEES
ncbi:hypothetical protein C8Q75DRAFT_811225 [Abortiporus biennis]|nr:hypothetical protein C8Q75DRAFT_811225 [Abortiporus biennis]